jgi:hypothetical protein
LSGAYMRDLPLGPDQHFPTYLVRESKYILRVAYYMSQQPGGWVQIEIWSGSKLRLELSVSVCE